MSDPTWSVTSATSIQVESSADGDTFTTLATLSGGSTSYADTGLSEATAHQYRIHAIYSGSSTDVDTLGMSKPAAPSGLSVTNDNGAVDLTWTDNSTNDSGANIYRSTDGTSYAVINSVPPGTAAYVDSGRHQPDGTTDYYKVATLNYTGQESAVSSVASLTPVKSLILSNDSYHGILSVAHGHTLVIGSSFHRHQRRT